MIHNVFDRTCTFCSFLPFRAHPCEQSMKPDPLWHEHGESQHGGITHRHMSKPLKHQSLNLPFWESSFISAPDQPTSPPTSTLSLFHLTHLSITSVWPHTFVCLPPKHTPAHKKTPGYTLLDWEVRHAGHSKTTTYLNMPSKRENREKRNSIVIFFNCYK